VGGSLRHYSPAQRAAVLSISGAEMSLFKYQTDLDSEALGTPAPGPPHALYFEPVYFGTGVSETQITVKTPAKLLVLYSRANPHN